MVRIFADSTCDLSKELVVRYGITVVPLHICLGEKEYKDRLEITPDEIYAWADENKTTPKTSAPSIEDASLAMKSALLAGDEIVLFSISQSMSTSGDVFRLAAEELEAEDRVSVVNSMNLSTGIGLLVIAAAKMAADGASREDIVSKIQELIPRVRASFVVDTLVYLHRGGRCSAVAALAGSMLKLHPEIVVKDGTMGVGQKYRGVIDHVIRKYVEDHMEEIQNAVPDRIFITHSGCDDAIVEEVVNKLEDLHYFKEVLVTRAGGVVSSHCGPGTLGVLYLV